jgi:taurine dioxygenase
MVSDDILPHFGSVVDVDVTTLDPTDRESIVHLLATRKVLIFPRQTLTATQLVRFSEILGKCWSNETPTELAGNGEEKCSHPDTRLVTLVSNDGRGVLNKIEIPWHNDIAHRPYHLPGNTLPFRTLYGEYITPSSVPTFWLDQEWLYDNLSNYHKEIVDERWGMFKAPYPTAWEGCRRPLVLTNPITGRKSLTVDMLFARQFDGFSVDETRAMKQYILGVGCVEQNVIKHVWSKGDLIINNNFNAAHYRPLSTDGQNRVLWRTTFQIEELVPLELVA